MYNNSELNNIDQHISLDIADACLTEVLSQQENKYFLLEHFVIAFGNYNTAVFLGYLLNKHYYYKRTRQLVHHPKHGDGWFYFTIDMCQEQLHLSRDCQDSCIKKLKQMGIIEVVTMGTPGQASIRRYFRLNIIEIAKIIESDEVTDNLRVSRKLTCGKATGRPAEKPQLPHIYNKNNNKLKDKTPPNPLKGEPVGDVSLPDKKPEKEKPEKLQTRENVTLSPDEQSKLTAEYGEPKLNQMLDILDAYKGSTGKRYKSDYHTLLPAGWVHKRWLEQKGSVLSPTIAKHRQGSKLVTPGDHEEDNFRRARL